jgi:uncharacterized protein (DUF1778 family)
MGRRPSNGEVSERVQHDRERGITRISFTITPTQRRNLRLAAALSDKDIGQWAVDVLTAAAEKAVPGVTKRKVRR